MNHTRREGMRGQALVLMVGAMVAVIAAVALIIDGGNAVAHQRISQNGADAAAEAGAVIMAERFAGANDPAAGWDSAVRDAVNASAAANGITVSAAYYTDICGIPLKEDGTAALNADGTYDYTDAQRVGAGLPATSTTNPDCPSRTVGPAAGVLVMAHNDVATYLAGAIGITSIGVSTQATAAAGYLQESCAAAAGNACGLLPIAVPVDVISCLQHNTLVDQQTPWPVDGHTVSVIPLCSNSPGNVGWLDWTPPSGGTTELINTISHPNNPAIPLPSWQYVTSTGNPNTSNLEDAIRAYDGQIVLVPQFDLTCNPGPNGTPDSTVPAVNTGDNYGCPPGDLGGNGSNQWYRMPSFAHLQLCISSDPDCAAGGYDHGAYINGNNSAICAAGGSTSCLVGKFESIISTGTIGAGFGGGQGFSKAIGVQLIK
ncbi:MAG TPA: pilus assembly protein TadG-related protein [Candidatus Limnocylindrales bacterium]